MGCNCNRSKSTSSKSIIKKTTTPSNVANKRTIITSGRRIVTRVVK